MGTHWLLEWMAAYSQSQLFGTPTQAVGQRVGPALITNLHLHQGSPCIQEVYHGSNLFYIRSQAGPQCVFHHPSMRRHDVGQEHDREQSSEAMAPLKAR